MTGQRLDGTDPHVIHRVSQNRLKYLGFADISDRSPGRVSVDVIDIARCDPRVVEGLPHRRNPLGWFWTRDHHVKRVAGRPESRDLGVSMSFACECVGTVLEDEHGSSFTQNHTVPVLVERAKGTMRRIVLSRKRPKITEAGHR
jgi:hypothetical protein